MVRNRPFQGLFRRTSRETVRRDVSLSCWLLQMGIWEGWWILPPPVIRVRAKRSISSRSSDIALVAGVKSRLHV